MCQKSLNFIYAFKCYQQIAINVGLSWPHSSWPTLYIGPVCDCVLLVLQFSVNIYQSISVYLPLWNSLVVTAQTMKRQ